MPSPTMQYNLFDIGYSRNLTKEDTFYDAIAKTESKVTSPVNPANIASGGVAAEVKIVGDTWASSNFVSGVSGWSLGPTSAEFVDVIISGTLTAGEIHIPDETSANSFHVNGYGDTWWGCNVADFASDVNNALAYVLKTGANKFDLVQRIAVNSTTFGNAGIQLEYNGGSSRAYVGDGANRYIKFDGTDPSWKGASSELTAAGKIITTSAEIGGFEVGATSITGGTTNIVIDSAGKAISINSATFGSSGLQFQYNSGVPRGYMGDGANQFFQYDGTNISFKGTNAELTTGGTLDVSNIVADGGNVGGMYLTNSTMYDNILGGASSSVLIDAGNSLIRLGPTSGSYVTLDGANQRMRSSNYVSGPTGSGFNVDTVLAEFGDIRARGKFTTLVMEYEAVSAVGGSLLVSKNTDVLDADMTQLDADTMTISGSVTFEVGDFLQIKDGVNEEWFEVTNNNNAPVYSVTRDKKGSYGADLNPAWRKGVAIINYGQSGDGGILLTASSINSPRMDVFTHAGSPWTSLTTRLRVGNLNGYLGLVDDVYGFGVGDASDFMRVYHDGAALQFKLSLTSVNSSAEIDVGSGGYLAGGQTAYNVGDGWWFEKNESDVAKASVGNGTQYLTYAAGEMGYKGALEAVYPVQLKTYATADLPIPIADTGVLSPSANA